MMRACALRRSAQARASPPSVPLPPPLRTRPPGDPYPPNPAITSPLSPPLCSCALAAALARLALKGFATRFWHLVYNGHGIGGDAYD